MLVYNTYYRMVPSHPVSVIHSPSKNLVFCPQAQGERVFNLQFESRPRGLAQDSGPRAFKYKSTRVEMNAGLIIRTRRAE